MKKILLLVGVGLLLFLPALQNKFVWDDEEQVVHNTAIHSLSNIPALLSGSTFNSGGSVQLGGGYYKPLMSVSFAALYTLFGAKSWVFHLLQVGLHLGTVCLLYIVLDKLWKNSWLAWLVALIFLIHPQNVETVVYISSLQDTLYMFLGMLGLTWVVISDKKMSFWDYVFAGICVFLALLGKETGGLFGILIGVYLVSSRTKRSEVERSHKNRFLDYARNDVFRWVMTMSIVLGLYLYLRIGVAGVRLEKNMFTPISMLPLLARLGNISGLVWHYLTQFVWPDKLSISQHWVNKSPGIWEWVKLSVITLGWLVGLGVKNNNFRFFWIWTGVALGFHLQIFPLDMTVADRWFYLPMVGVLGVVGSVAAKLRSLQKYAKIVTIGVGIILIGLFVRSTIRIQNWRDGMTLYAHDIQIMSESFDLQNNYGVELYRAGRLEEAKKRFEKSTELSPTWWVNWNNLGAIVEREGQLDLALEYYNKAIQNGNYYLSYPNYGRVLLKQKKYDEARQFLENTLRIYPKNKDLLELYKYSRYTGNQ